MITTRGKNRESRRLESLTDFYTTAGTWDKVSRGISLPSIK